MISNRLNIKILIAGNFIFYNKKVKSWIYSPAFYLFYDLTILSDVLTKTNAAEIGITTTITAKITLLKKALNEGVILKINKLLMIYLVKS